MCLFDKTLCWLYPRWLHSAQLVLSPFLLLNFYQPVQDCCPTSYLYPSSTGSRLSTKQKYLKLTFNQDLFTFPIERWTDTKHEENGVRRQNLSDTISNVPQLWKRPPQENTVLHKVSTGNSGKFQADRQWSLSSQHVTLRQDYKYLNAPCRHLWSLEHWPLQEVHGGNQCIEMCWSIRAEFQRWIGIACWPVRMLIHVTPSVVVKLVMSIKGRWLW